MWIKLLLKNWQYIVIAILLTTNAFTISLYLDKRDELTVCEVNYEGKKAEVVSCNGLIGKQNIAIQDWVIKGKELESRIRGLTEDIAIIETKYSKEIQSINDMNIPKSCDGSMKWLVEQGKKL